MPDQELTPYEQIVKLLETHHVSYRTVEHEPEGRAVPVSQIRGNRLSQAVNSLVVMVKIGKKGRRFYLANLPADRRLDLNAVQKLCQGTHALLAPLEKVAELTRCTSGAVPPFSFHPDLELIADPAVFDNEEIVFNAGRLDRSIFMKPEDYRRIVQPRLVPIALLAGP
jgi:Ala-tRNA(Pro) deacylase